MSEEQNQDQDQQQDQQEQQQSWRDSLPETLREAPFIKEAKDPDDAFAQIKHAAQYMGQAIRIPGEDAGEEDKAAFLTRLMEKVPELMVKPNLEEPDEQAHELWRMLGKPEKADDYKYNPAEGEEMPPNIAKFAEIAFANNLNQSQFQNMVDAILDSEQEINNELDESHRQDLMNLHAQWGMAFDQNVRALDNFLQMTEAPEVIQEMLKNNEMTASEMRWLFSIATQTQSAVELAKQPSSVGEILSPELARSKISEILSNPTHPYHNPGDPGNAAAIQKMIDLHQMANPSSTRAIPGG